MIGQGIQEKQALRRGVHTGGEKLRLLQQNAAALRPISQQKGWCFSIPERTFHFFHRVFH